MSYNMHGTEEYAAWVRRAQAVYVVGERVTVGPAYRGNGHYAPDGSEGTYHVVARLGTSQDYKLAPIGETDWTYIVNASRLTSASRKVRSGG